MIYLKNKNEIEKLYTAGQIVKDTLYKVEEYIQPGIKTSELDRIAEEFILSKNAKPGFKGLYGYPSTLCISIDNEVVHGLPSNRELKEGQIVGIDVGSIFEGYFGDHAKTFKVGKVDDKLSSLVDITRKSLYIGIDQVKPGNYIGDIGYAIQNYAESKGYSVVRELVGHGIGKNLHEEPQVPNYGMKGTGAKIEIGMCLAIEPMINIGSADVKTMDDGWTVVTKDGSFSAHFEHSVAVTDNGTIILSK